MGKWLLYPAGLVLLLLLQFAGESLKEFLSLPVPGPVLGMIMLFILLSFHKPVLQLVEPAGNLLVRHLSLMFLPAVAGMVMTYSSFRVSPASLAVMMLSSTVIAILATALLMNFLAMDEPHQGDDNAE